MRVGDVIIVKTVFPSIGLEKAAVGVVYETYPDFDDPLGSGVSIVFENGEYDGWSLKEQQMYLQKIGHSSEHENYVFQNVRKVIEDFENEYWNFSKIKKEIINE